MSKADAKGEMIEREELISDQAALVRTSQRRKVLILGRR